MTNIWEQCKEELSSKINSHNFESWINPTEFVQYENNTLQIKVPNSFFIDWINEHYIELIQEILSRKTKHDNNIQFVVVEKSRGKGGPVSVELKGGLEPPVINNLKPEYTFGNFVSGKSNEFALAACKAVANKPFSVYNPLFIYGGVGLGKTHLLHSIGNFVLSQSSKYKVVYVSSENFVNNLITSLQKGRMDGFRKKYRSLDILMVDDIQFIGGKERTQEEFFHTFNSLFEMGRQIIISSDQYPKNIQKLEERLRSRFEWGLISDIQPPELETRVAILQKKARICGHDLNQDVALLLAKKVRSNIRELEGILARVIAYSSLTRKPINLDLAEETLSGIYSDAQKNLDIKQIQKAVCDHFQIKVSDMKSKKRQKFLMVPRQLAIYLCREYTQISLPQIGKDFGNRDHSTILHAYQKIKNDIEVNTQLYNDLNSIKSKLDL